LPGGGVVALLAALRNRRLWFVYLILAAILVAAIGALAVNGIEPFARALMQFDGTWFEIVHRRCWFAFVTRWQWFGILGPIAHGVVLLIAWRLATGPERHLLGAALIVAAVGMAMTYLGGDLARDVLVVNLQPWRAFWILAVVSNAWASVVALRLPESWLSRDLLLVGMVCQAMVTAAETRIALAGPIIVLAGFAFLWEWRKQQPLRGAVRYAVWLTAAVLVAFVALALFAGLRLRSESIPLWQLMIALSATAAVGIALGLSARREFQPSRLMMLIAAIFIFTGLASIDRRDAWQKFIEAPGLPLSLAGFVGEMRNIYWEEQPAFLWLKLGRPSYYSCLQGTGVMFYRNTALEYQRRSNGLSRLNTLDFDENTDGSCIPKQDPLAEGPQSREQLVAACRELPELEAIVLRSAVPGTTHTQWHLPVSHVPLRKQAAERIDTYYMYQCSALR
jgi:hypothetical protein